jgi:hypothetical protein
MEYLGASWTLIHEKKMKSKISCQTPFNIRRNSRKFQEDFEIYYYLKYLFDSVL